MGGRTPRQGSLFGEPPEPEPDVTPAAAFVPRHEELRRLLPPTLRLGTSSWAFPGWRGLVYGERAKTKQLSRGGLHAYAQHPLLRTVGVDRTFYAPITQHEFAAYAQAVPDDFRFLVKAWSECLTPRLRGPGGRPGAANPRYLDADAATDLCLSPAALGLGDKLGVLLLQFPPQGAAVCREPKAFAARLHAFLTKLPRGAAYAVELRDAELLCDDYAAALDAVGAQHCCAVHPSMPGVLEQHQRAPSRSSLTVRWMLQPGARYEEAVQKYEPFDCLVDPDPVRREEVAVLCARSLLAGLPVTVIANNKAEGSAPLTLAALAERIAAQLPTTPPAPAPPPHSPS
jgi:uncharacterized protein YecE (DUF72 family)